MPELPEVETIKRELEREIKGRTIIKVKNLDAKVSKDSPISLEKVKGRIREIKRRAKLLLIFVDSLVLVIHLKLTGQLLYQKKLQKDKSTRIVFYLNRGFLVFNDPRRFGFIKVFTEKQLKDYLQKVDYGIEPLSKKFTLDAFKKIIDNRETKIKQLLMDQSKIAGIGNVYSVESLFESRILPTRTAKSLNEKEITTLYKALRKILIKAIKYKGASVDTYLDLYGKKGKMVPFLKVYGREGKPCFRCKGKIKRIMLGGRGTYFCPSCQK
ncbi:DNA-formamidopyrimidine glycosylase [Candidatus Pacearchaeota archaeon ex4484_26]|nr:MAG: DNA-formamidopyrimidine glycosylase [Candidatus Pacearchaeota archaeon ex4484_26]